jgi:hypothetical protein
MNTQKIQRVVLFENGGIAVIDDLGHQIPELQRGLPVLWAEHAERNGFDPAGVVIEARSGSMEIVRNADGSLNWKC